METTTPVPLALEDEKASELGLFAAGDEGAVLSNLRNDLLATGETPEDLLQRYVAGTEAYAGAGSAPKSMAKDASDVIARLLHGQSPVEDLPRVVRVLYFSGRHRLLAKHHLRFPAYNILDEYFVNVAAPWGPTVLPRPRADRSWHLFGHQIGFPIGVPASVLTGNHRWIQYFATNGFNVLTYKTVRSRAHTPNTAPNWLFVVDEREPWEVGDDDRTVIADPWDWVDPGNASVSTANSFGVPSPEPREWMADVGNALEAVASDQLLIVSVLGDDYGDGTPTAAHIIEDFVRVATLAEQAGAKVVELNLSCPNSLDTQRGGVKDPVCFDSKLTRDIVAAVRSALAGSTSLVAKLSYLRGDKLGELVHEIAPNVDGIAGINTLQCAVQRASGEEAFPGRARAGVSGIAVRNYALEFAFNLRRLRTETGKYFEIIGMGGVTDAQSFLDLYEAGSDVVQTASGAFANPFLAAECLRALGEDLPNQSPMTDTDLKQNLQELIISQVSKEPLPMAAVMASLPMRAGQAQSLIGELVASKTVRLRRGLLSA